MAFFMTYLLAVFYLFSFGGLAIVLDVDNQTSVRDAAATVAYGLQSLYNGNESGGDLGKFPYPPIYWWESGGAWGGMMEYWHYTGDQSYLNVTYEALVSQVGPNYDWVVPSESFDEGNDDQAFWVFAAMSAAENRFPDPPSPIPSWLTTVQNAWQLFTQRWNTTNCAGGLKWQFYEANVGFYYKNAISNGAFFQLSARLARHTGNQTYVDWAEKVYNWTSAIGLIDDIYNVFDGTDELINCSGIDHHQWTYNVGVFLYGAAIMQNYTNSSDIWVERTNGLLAATSTFISPYKNGSSILFEAQCELDYSCNIDQQSMKAYLARWMAGTAQLAPWTAGKIGGLLRTSAQGAAASCSGPPDGKTCGTRWYTNGFDNRTGVGQQLAAMEVIYALLVNETTPPMTLPNVVIRDVPPNITTSTSSSSTAEGTSAATARPLFDSHQGGAGAVSWSGVCIGFMITLAAAIFALDGL